MASGAGSYGTVSVGATAQLLLAGRTLRDKVIIQNVHASQILYLGFDNAVTAANGLRLNAGESVELSVTTPIWAIASGAATDTRYIESA